MTQRLYPALDASTEDWTKSGSGGFFFDRVDEDPTANDDFGTYVRTTTHNASLRLFLSAGVKPAEFDGWVLRVAWTLETPDLEIYTLSVELRDDQTLIGTLTDVIDANSSVHDMVTAIEYPLTADEVSLVTSMDQLWVWISCYSVGFTGTPAAVVTAVDLLIPDGQIIQPIVHGYI